MNSKDIILQFIRSHDWDGMDRMLRGLSNMEFRRMEQAVRVSVLPSLSNDLYWESLLHLIIFKRAAFISGITSCGHLINDGTLAFDNNSVEALYEHLKNTNPDSLTKMANMLLPLMKDEKQITEMFEAFHIDNDITRLAVLLKVDSPLSYYLIFKTLKMVDDRLVARKCCLSIMKRNTDMAFNAVSLIKTFWALDDLPARFSLNIPEYELNHIERNYSNFEHILNGKRPKI